MKYTHYIAIWIHPVVIAENTFRHRHSKSSQSVHTRLKIIRVCYTCLALLPPIIMLAVALASTFPTGLLLGARQPYKAQFRREIPGDLAAYTPLVGDLTSCWGIISTQHDMFTLTLTLVAYAFSFNSCKKSVVM